MHDRSEEEMEDLFGIVADGETDAGPEDGFGFVGPAHIRQYFGVAPGGGNAPKDFYSVGCIWPVGDPAGVEDACALIAESFRLP